MGIFGSIVSAIFGGSKAAAGTTAAAPTSTGASAPSAAAPSAAAPSAAAKPISRAEVEAMIKKIADAQKEKLNWKESIVDLMKLLKLDSSLAARKELAHELEHTILPLGTAATTVA